MTLLLKQNGSESVESNATHPNVLCRVQYLINRKAADQHWKNGDDHIISLPADEFDEMKEALKAKGIFFAHPKIAEHSSRHWADDPGVIFFCGCWVTRGKA